MQSLSGRLLNLPWQKINNIENNVIEVDFRATVPAQMKLAA